jgi:hypothetical protein
MIKLLGCRVNGQFVRILRRELGGTAADIDGGKATDDFGHDLGKSEIELSLAKILGMQKIFHTYTSLHQRRGYGCLLDDHQGDTLGNDVLCEVPGRSPNYWDRSTSSSEGFFYRHHTSELINPEETIRQTPEFSRISDVREIRLKKCPQGY